MNASETQSSRSAWTAIVCTVAVLLSLPLRAQQYVFDTYQQERGLSNLSTKDVAFDRSGFLWIATENGLFRLLGSHFDRFGPEQGLKERDVNRVYADPSGRVWAATYENLYRWDGYRFAPAAKTRLPMYLNESMEAVSPERFLVQSRYHLFELTLDAAGNVLSMRPYFSDEQLRRQPDLKRIVTHIRTPDGTIWLASNGKLYACRDGRIQSWDVEKGVPSDLWLSLHVDRHGAIWAVSQKYVVVLAAGGSRFEDRTPPDTDAGGVFRTLPILEDRQGRILVDTASGISRWDGRAWQTIGPANGFTSSHITCMAVDREGDPWLGSIAIGLVHWTGYEHWEAWTDAQGLPSSIIWSFSPAHGGGMVIGTTKGPARLSSDHLHLESLVPAGKWPYGQVSGIVEQADGTIWMVTFGGWVVRIDPGTHPSVHPVSQSTRFFYGIHPDADGRLWMNSNTGVDEIVGSGKNAIVRHDTDLDRLLRESDIKSKSPHTVLASGGRSDPGTLWLMTGAGLLQRKNGLWSSAAIDGLSLSQAIIEDIASAPDGSLWIYGLDETEHGVIWHLVPRKTAAGPSFQSTSLPLPAGMRDLSPMSMRIDRRGWLWLATDVGLDVWNGSQWRHLSHESGLIWNDTNRGVMLEDPDGSLWIGTSGGAAHLIHPETIFNESPVAVEITSMTRGALSLPPREVHRLPHAGLPLLFEFATPNLLNRSDLLFNYRIADLQSDWVSTLDTQAAFTSLQSGEHRFEVFAYNRNTGERSATAQATVIILPPWWQTFWFYCLCVLAICVAIWFFTGMRTRNLLLKQQKLEALIDERTAELKLSQEELRRLALYDELTGLSNRRAILERLAGELDRARREQIQVVVMLIDIDHFKEINDTHGHLAGDQALRLFGEKLAQVVRPYDHAGRYGGEEFLLILSNLPNNFVTSRLTQLHAEITGLPIEFGSLTFNVNCSMGVVTVLHDGVPLDPTEVLSRADAALYLAKSRGRNRVVFAKGGASSAPSTAASASV